ncbi:MAG: MerR family transcriptional regulator [Proteobacteria bacterium]|nr:MerR family transcriptional regulator [Pseudomonadota bacterium]MBU1450486.1 MerR family transcriptional regulator [Pseudomonadota bacterium]MBU2469601.1 MerR family transcriptional regulator [Pseudomonadota bacterium]MBU2516672.1 MerR family transcriptional regulator [Pseudomonadota bacterium]
MKQLMAATGLPKSTLLYYAEQGLLPPPVKTSPNMAYYDPACVERARRIKQLQSQHRLPLSKIKVVLEAQDRGEAPEALIALGQEIFGQEQGPLLGKEEFRRQSGLSRKALEEFLAAGLLLPLEPGRFNQQDLAMGRLLAQAWARGVGPKNLAYYNRLGQRIVDEEMALRRSLTQDLPPAVDAEVTLALTQAARAMRGYVIDRLFQHRVAGARHLKDEEMLS